MYNIRKLGIRMKFLILVLVIVFLSAASFTFFSIREMLNIERITQTANESLGASAARTSAESLQDLAAGSFMLLTQSNINVIDERLNNWLGSINMLSEYITNINLHPDEYLPMPPPVTDAANKGIPAFQARFAPGVTYESVKEETDRLVSTKHILEAVYLKDSDFLTVYLGTESGILLGYDKDSNPEADKQDFEFRQRDWYIMAKERGDAVFAPLSEDFFDRGMTITVAAPFYDANGDFSGVCAIDIAAENLSRTIMDTNIINGGFAFLVGRYGQVFSNQPMLKEVAYKELSEFSDIEPEFSGVVKQIMEGGNGYETISISGNEVFVFYGFLDKASWGYGIILPVNEVIAPAFRAKSSIDLLTENVQAELTMAINRSITAFVIIFIATVLISMILGVAFADRLTKPILELTRGVAEISRWNIDADLVIHNYDVHIDVKTGDEIESLANNFNIMTDRLNSYIIDLAKITAEKERIATELSVAKQIQASMLPCIFPPFPDRPEFDIYATMTPAKEVGGDFYDFFLIDENTLAVVIADVSGKGIAAALFMVITKTLIKNHATMNKNPSHVFHTVNNMLCENNSAYMFVTAFIGVLDLKSNMFSYCNAGHNPPVIKRPNEGYSFIKQKPGFVLAAFPNFVYETEQMQLNKGDLIFLYTDGVTETMNPSHEIFTEGRLLDSLKSYGDSPLTDLLVNIKNDLDVFAAGELQADDITMLSLKIR